MVELVSITILSTIKNYPTFLSMKENVSSLWVKDSNPLCSHPILYAQAIKLRYAKGSRPSSVNGFHCAFPSTNLGDDVKFQRELFECAKVEKAISKTTKANETLVQSTKDSWKSLEDTKTKLEEVESREEA